MKKIFISSFILFFLNASAQNDFNFKSSPKYKIWLYNGQENLTNGFLVSTSDSTAKIFTGKLSEWRSSSKISVTDQFYSNIDHIKIHKKGGLIKGVLIGAGIVFYLVGSLFGPSIGEGGAYVSIIAFPIGIITGAIIGSTSREILLLVETQPDFICFSSA